jgi:uncharacterized protein
MQSIIETLRVWLGGSLGWTIGLVLIGAFVVQVTALAFSSVLRAFKDREQRRQSRERLRLLVKAAALQCQKAEQARLSWNGFRKFQIARKVKECDGVWSFYLQPHDRKPLVPFQPGQYLTFQLKCARSDKPVVRCYSISDSPHRTEYYRVTIKRADPPPDRSDLLPGVASSHFCDVLHEGDIIDAKAPAGHFCLDLEKTTPVVLISAGVGVTPMLCMANAIAATGVKRECWFFFGVRNGSEYIHRSEIETLARTYDNIQVHTCYSRPQPEEKLGVDYQHEGRVSVELLKQLLPSNNYEYYLCGPGPFMNSITDGLRDWGVPDTAVFFEAFGPATVKRKVPPAPSPAEAAAAAPAFQVTFSKSGKTCAWRPDLGSLLDFAEHEGLRIEAGCRAGNCGTCVVAIKSGAVEYLERTGAQPDDSACLTCVCKPKSDLVLDA